MVYTVPVDSPDLVPMDLDSTRRRSYGWRGFHDTWERGESVVMTEGVDFHTAKKMLTAAKVEARRYGWVVRAWSLPPVEKYGAYRMQVAIWMGPAENAPSAGDAI